MAANLAACSVARAVLIIIHRDVHVADNPSISKPPFVQVLSESGLQKDPFRVLLQGCPLRILSQGCPFMVLI